VDQKLNEINQVLIGLVGLHRQLLETVRFERTALVDADLKAIESTTANKQILIEKIYQAEANRVKLTTELAFEWKKPLKELTLLNIIIEIQGRDPKGADQLRSVYNTLTVLVQRISSQNLDNQSLLHKSLEHITEMKMNILGAAETKSSTYTQQGQKTNPTQSSRLLSKEA
jgi:flagellar biosynthesis/type III secretory pathway chaperone